MKHLLLLFCSFIALLDPIGAYSNSESKISELLAQLEQTTDDSVKTDLHCQIVNTYTAMLDKTEALKHAEAAYVLALKTGNMSQLFLSYQNLIILTIKTGNMTKSINYCYEALEKFPVQDYPENQAYIFNELSRIYTEKDDRVKSENYMEKAIQIARKYKLNFLPVYLSNRGYTYIEKGEYDKALSSLKESYGITKNVQFDYYDVQNNVYAAIHMSYVYFKIGKADSAQYYTNIVRKSLKQLHGKAEYPILTMIFHKTQAKMLSEQKEYKKSIAHLDSVLEITQKVDNLVMLRSTLQKLSETHALNRNIQKALDYKIKYAQLSDSLSNEELIQTEKTLKQNLQLREEKREQEKKHLISQLEKQRSVTQRNLVLFIAIVLGLVSLSLFIYIRERIRKNKIHLVKLELEKRNMELELINKNADVSNYLLKIVSINKLMQFVEKELNSHKGELDKDLLKKTNRLIKKIKSHSHSDIWTEFELRFNQIHQGFYDNLCKEYANLSPNERKLCGFLKLNMSSKEISSITGQTPNSIVKARVRLRKKLRIDNTEIGLVEFFDRY